jgi:hypothetical protein
MCLIKTNNRIRHVYFCMKQYWDTCTHFYGKVCVCARVCVRAGGFMSLVHQANVIYNFVYRLYLAKEEGTIGKVLGHFFGRARGRHNLGHTFMCWGSRGGSCNWMMWAKFWTWSPNMLLDSTFTWSGSPTYGRVELSSCQTCKIIVIIHTECHMTGVIAL